MDQDIVQYLRNKYNLLVAERIAEQIKWQIGSAYPCNPKKHWKYAAEISSLVCLRRVEISSVKSAKRSPVRFR